ncbi:MarR family winged helix-turn-helix transcriptional regulator [Tardiphaga sp. vice278]|jgi:DNA-binding MarR family transcriptional regulator|uniref:MarR family winged helix-turn-helix transcriptional regulator n=1 Tax=Tardiphaga sp. vice278 TaxID=2592815 RepID=UPI001162A1A0|nr:MarR family transcriptional regulator [Tardiphaga sp. vice278]QDM18188.1 MarR family transcriptional regulator [Tardiphaga sp. vice278]
MADELTEAPQVSPITDLPMELFWEIDGLSRLFLEIQNHWAKALGVTAPQFLILQAVRELGWKKGAAVKDVAARLKVHPSFITAETKGLVKSGLVEKMPSKLDARVVLLSLSDRARSALESLHPHREALNSFVFASVDDDEMEAIINQFRSLKRLLSKGLRSLAVEDDS